jgi:hypothetical protein
LPVRWAARGASRLTQQLAKNLFLSRGKRLGRKLQELAITFLLESALGKDRILEIYLNIIEWGPDLHGLRHAGPWAALADRRPAGKAPVGGSDKRGGISASARRTHRRRQRQAAWMIGGDAELLVAESDLQSPAADLWIHVAKAAQELNVISEITSGRASPKRDRLLGRYAAPCRNPFA